MEALFSNLELAFILIAFIVFTIFTLASVLSNRHSAPEGKLLTCVFLKNRAAKTPDFEPQISQIYNFIVRDLLLISFSHREKQ
uniref:Uncharacterized protein n=1 Tax=Paramormyrops kingsleyae TaxID=1676925 RepID=A0A3B3Q830_9TELE